MKYHIEYRCWASIDVEADSFDDALAKADEKWFTAFANDKTGFVMEYGEPCLAEDENEERMELY